MGYCDETFLPLDYTREKAVTKKNAKNVYVQARGTTDHITMLCGASAAGLPLPPMIIYPKAFPGGQYRCEGPDDAVYAKSESGWVDSELFLAWMKKVFIAYSDSERPVILFVDGHKSHLTLDTIDLAHNNGITLFCLPPHTTHALQPLDVAVFKSLKDHFAKTVRSLTFTRMNFIISKREFAKIVKAPFEKAFSITNIKAGFAKSGIYPFNPNAVDECKMIPATLHHSDLYSSESTLTTDQSSSTPVPPSSASGSSDWFECTSLSQTEDSGSTTSTPVTPSVPLPSLDTTPINPLVAAGMVPSYLTDLLAIPPEDADSQLHRNVLGGSPAQECWWPMNMSKW